MDSVVELVAEARAELDTGMWLPSWGEMVLAEALSQALAEGRAWAGMRRAVVAAIVAAGPDTDLGRLGPLAATVARRMEPYELAELYDGQETSGDHSADARMLAAVRELAEQMWGAGLGTPR